MNDTDSESIFTFAKYLEPLTIMRVNIDEFRDEIASQIFQTWFRSRQSISALRTCRATPALFKDETVFTWLVQPSLQSYHHLYWTISSLPSSPRVYRQLPGTVTAIGEKYFVLLVS